MTAFAGIDYDTTGIYIVWFDDDEAVTQFMAEPLDGHDAFDRAREVRDAMPARSWWDDQGIVAIGIEEQNSQNPKMRNTVAKLKMIQGAILSCLPRETLVNPMNASHWRTTCGLPGNCPKEDVREWARTNGFSLLGSYALAQDLADAFCMAKAVEKLTVPA